MSGLRSPENRGKIIAEFMVVIASVARQSMPPL
jgi:hypothetical protein